MADTNKQQLAEALRRVLAEVAPYTQHDTAGRPWLKQAVDALVQYDRSLKPTPTEQAYIDAAYDVHDSDDIDIDSAPVVSEGLGEGAYVQAWVWVSRNAAGLATDDEEGDEDDADEIQ